LCSCVWIKVFKGQGQKGVKNQAQGVVRDEATSFNRAPSPILAIKGEGNVVVGSVESLGRRNGEVLRRRISG